MNFHAVLLKRVQKLNICKPSKERVRMCKDYFISRKINTVLKIAVDNKILELCDSCDYFGPGCTRGQNCFCCDKISDKYLFPVNFIWLCLGSHAFAFLSYTHQKENFPALGPNDITLLLLSKSCFSAHDCTN